MNTLPLLSLLILLPLAGALALALSPAALVRRLALLIAGLELLLSAVVLQQFNVDAAGFQLVERYQWIPSLSVEILLGVDGLSVLFLPMSALLVGVVLYLNRSDVQKFRLYSILVLVLEAATIGIFTALDTVLFFLFWELTLPALFFLISRFGAGPERRTAAMKYTLYMLFGGAPLLFAFIILALNHAAVTGVSVPAGLSFSLPELLSTDLAPSLQITVFVLMLLGFGVKVPLVPFHTWLPKTAMEGPAQITALLLGLKLGVYGVVRFMLPLVPTAIVEFQRELALLGAVTLIYGALLALRQSNLRSLLAYAGISHVGLVVMGLASLTVQGIQGSLLHLFNFTLIAAPLMLLSGAIQQRTGSTELVHLSGLATRMPRLAVLMFLFALASLGAPLTPGLPAELLLLVGNFKAHPGLGITALTGALIGAAALLLFLRKAFWGPLGSTNQQLQDLLPHESRVYFSLAVLLLVLGLFPQLLLQFTETATATLLLRY